MPSTRQIVERYGVAMATATKVLTELRLQGLVRAEPGVGTVWWSLPRPAGHGRRRPPRPSMQEQVVRAAVRIADAEGLAGLSMRRLAGELGVPTMSLYRHVADKEELLLLMMDRVFAANPPPDPAPDGWRAQVEALARLQWSVYRRHPWLAQAVSFTRPLLAPNAMAHTEWAMRALDGFGLDGHTLFLAAVTVANYVRGTAVNLEAEAQAEQDTGLTDDEWMRAQQDRFAAVLATASRYADASSRRRFDRTSDGVRSASTLMVVRPADRRMLDGAGRGWIPTPLSARRRRPPRSPGSAR